MQLPALVLALPALALRASTAAAAALPRRQDPHIVDFRTYGAPGCAAANQGVYTYLQSDLGVCRPFADAVVGSLFVVDVADGCAVYAYTDAACAEDQVAVPLGIENCYNATAAGLGSFQVLCSS